MLIVDEVLLSKTGMKAILYLSDQVYLASRCYDVSSLANVLWSFFILRGQEQT